MIYAPQAGEAPREPRDGRVRAHVCVFCGRPAAHMVRPLRELALELLAADTSPGRYVCTCDEHVGRVS